MSKKRKTRSQKEKAVLRRDNHVAIAEKEVVTPTVSYSVSDIDTPPRKSVQEAPKSELAHHNHLTQDMRTIGAATGIVLAFDILLFTLLSTGVLKLGFLGY